MTSHMMEFVRTFSRHAGIRGPVLEVGSYIEVNQDHLDFRGVFPPGTPYLGVDVIDGNGVDRKMDLLDEAQVNDVLADFQPKIILCLYVIEHVWDILGAARSLASMWERDPESWLFIATHQNQPYHGTHKYPDYWRLTASGLGKLMDEVGLPDAKVFATSNLSNPEDVVAIQKPRSTDWSGEAVTKTVRDIASSIDSPMRWEQYR